MKTINERIVSAAREVDQLCQSLGLAYPNDLEDILAKHFSNPWLDAPGGPGWWWLKSGDKTTMHEVGKYPENYGMCHPGQWQRAIGPSE